MAPIGMVVKKNTIFFAGPLRLCIGCPQWTGLFFRQFFLIVFNCFPAFEGPTCRPLGTYTVFLLLSENPFLYYINIL